MRFREGETCQSEKHKVGVRDGVGGGRLHRSWGDVKSCGGTSFSPESTLVQRRLFTGSELPLRPQDETECRRCDVHCDKVVYPAACVAGACPFLYAYREAERTYIGCMQKVYDVEIDLDLLEEAQGLKGGFGAVKATRPPLPMCRAEVTGCYQNRAGELGCVNPEFFELPRAKPSFRVFAQVDVAE